MLNGTRMSRQTTTEVTSSTADSPCILYTLGSPFLQRTGYFEAWTKREAMKRLQVRVAQITQLSLE